MAETKPEWVDYERKKRLVMACIVAEKSGKLGALTRLHIESEAKSLGIPR
jgi:hypothetical protein